MNEAAAAGKGETYAVFNPITPLAQDVVLQIQQLESREEVFDEGVDLERAVVVAQGDRVDGETGLFVILRQIILTRLKKGRKKERGVLTSSSTSEINARRYSSIVRWKASSPLRLTGTLRRLVN